MGEDVVLEVRWEEEDTVVEIEVLFAATAAPTGIVTSYRHPAPGIAIVLVEHFKSSAHEGAGRFFVLLVVRCAVFR